MNDTWETKNRRYQAETPAEVVRVTSADNPDFLFGGECAPYDPANYEWSEEPPDDGICRKCYEWRRYPEGQRHFGLAWWRVCGRDCDHAHHDDELWMA